VGRGRGVCGTTRETSCRGVCCARFFKIFFLVKSKPLLRIGRGRGAARGSSLLLKLFYSC
jgi:hypothetical protein